MDSIETYRRIIRETLIPYTRIPYSNSDVLCRTVFDRNSDTYLLLTLGWGQARRIHGCLVHIDIIDGKVWIQRDDTEEGVTPELVAAGIPKEHIVLGFHPPEVRPHTGYAIA